MMGETWENYGQWWTNPTQNIFDKQVVIKNGDQKPVNLIFFVLTECNPH